MADSLTTRTAVAVSMLVLAFFALLFSPIYAAVFVLLAIGSFYYLTPRCASCGARGSVRSAGSEVIKEERAYGIVTRKETVTKKKTDSQGRVVDEDTVHQREERAPVIRRTVRMNYVCSKCGNKTSRTVVTQEEDFSVRDGPPSAQTVIIQKEVVKVPCRYCGALNDIATQRTCANCGAVIK